MRIRHGIGAIAVFGISASMFPGCNQSQVLTVTDYDQSCTVDSDCVAVKTGDVCNMCCDNVAINESSIPQWNTDDAAIDCSGSFLDCADCPVVAFCRGGSGSADGPVLAGVPPHCDLRSSAGMP